MERHEHGGKPHGKRTAAYHNADGDHLAPRHAILDYLGDISLAVANNILVTL